MQNLPTEEQPPLFDLGEANRREPEVIRPDRPIWTENKARLIDRYLYYFVLITRHGTYIDGFAGPQNPAMPDSWAAKLVLESRPQWLRHFYLFDSNRKQYDHLEELHRAQNQIGDDGKPLKRTIRVEHGDFNELVHPLLTSGQIGEREAAFVLLDQRTFECHWSTVEALARYKTVGHKLELFYFFPVRRLDRALSAIRDPEKLERWWGRNDFRELRDLHYQQRVELVVDRFRSTLGYASVKPWPIFERENGGPVMYYMVHATDHPEAPKLMSRAYRNAVNPKETAEQLVMDLGLSDGIRST